MIPVLIISGRVMDGRHQSELICPRGRRYYHSSQSRPARIYHIAINKVMTYQNGALHLTGEGTEGINRVFKHAPKHVGPICDAEAGLSKTTPAFMWIKNIHLYFPHLEKHHPRLGCFCNKWMRKKLTKRTYLMDL